jgi:hypothetical protein
VRVVQAVVSVAMLFAVGQVAHAQVVCAFRRPSQTVPAQVIQEKLYVVECRIVKKLPDGKKDVLIGPRVTIDDGRTAVVNNVTQTPIVASVAQKRGGEEPRITVLKEGTTIELTVHSEGDGWVTLDASIETSKIADLKTKDAGEGRHRQCARVESRRVRVMELTAMGEEFAVPFVGHDGQDAHRTMEFVVYTPDMPRHWYSKSEMAAAARRQSWLWQMWLVTLRALAAQ